MDWRPPAPRRRRRRRHCHRRSSRRLRLRRHPAPKRDRAVTAPVMGSGCTLKRKNNLIAITLIQDIISLD